MLVNTFSRNDLTPALHPDNAEIGAGRLPVGVDYPKGKVLGCVSVVQRNDVKTITITGTPTGGTWTFSLLGNTSDAIAYNATAAQVQTAVDAFWGAGHCTVTGGPGPGTAWVFTFGGVLGNVMVKGITVSGAFTGGTTPAIAIVDTTPGSSGAGQMDTYDDGASNGTQTARAILKTPFKSDIFGGNANEHGATGQPTNAVVYTGGYFNVSDLTGLDANGVTDLGRMAIGTAFNTTGGVLKVT